MEINFKIMEQIKIEDRKNDFLNIIDVFFNQLKFGKNYPETINLGLNVLFNIPGAIYAAYFEFDKENFDFHHIKTVPKSFNEASNLAFKRFVDTPIFGDSLTNGKISYIDDIVTDSNDLVYILTPLLSRIGFEGIGIILLDKDHYELSSFDNKLIQLFASSFANIITSFNLERQLINNSNLLEQKVATRTLAIEKSRREINAIIDFVQTAILIINYDSQIITSINPAAEKLIGLPQDEIIGKRFDLFLIDESINFNENIANTEEFVNFESRLICSDNKIVPIIRSYVNLELGDIKCRIESFLDISEQKEAHKLLVQTNEILELKVKERTEELEIIVDKLRESLKEREKLTDNIQHALEKEKELSELKTRFVTMVSHEFRTPLTVIRSAAQLIQNFNEKLQAQEKQDYLNRIVKSVDILKYTLENALFIGKTDANQDVKFTFSNIGELCRQIVESVILSFDKKRVVNYIFSGEFQNAYIDENLIRHIFTNLISNAIKYSANDKEVDFYVKHLGNSLEFQVRDYGIGISNSDKEKLFEMFHRGENVGAIAGTGIGLSVVKRSVDLLKGEISVETELGMGTTFKIDIPNNNEFSNEL